MGQANVRKSDNDIVTAINEVIEPLATQGRAAPLLKHWPDSGRKHLRPRSIADLQRWERQRNSKETAATGMRPAKRKLSKLRNGVPIELSIPSPV